MREGRRQLQEREGGGGFIRRAAALGKGPRRGRAVTVVEAGAREACDGRSPARELGDGGGVGWAVAWPGSWAGPVGEGSSFF